MKFVHQQQQSSHVKRRGISRSSDKVQNMARNMVHGSWSRYAAVLYSYARMNGTSGTTAGTTVLNTYYYYMKAVGALLWSAR